MSSSWKEISDQLDKESAAAQQRSADEQARRERKRAADLEEVAKADQLVQEFLRAARSVGNPGTKDEGYYSRGGDSLISSLIFTPKFKVTDRYWAYGENKSIGFRLPDGRTARVRLPDGRTARVIHGTVQADTPSLPDGFVIKVSGHWWYKSTRRDSEAALLCKLHIGRNAAGLFCDVSGADRRGLRIADHFDPLQRNLVEIMRENGIPFPD